MTEFMKKVINTIRNGNFLIIIDNGKDIEAHTGHKLSNNKIRKIGQMLQNY